MKTHITYVTVQYAKYLSTAITAENNDTYAVSLVNRTGDNFKSYLRIKDKQDNIRL